MSAEAIRDFYLEHPEATLGDVAKELGLQPHEVHRIMDTHLVTGDGIEEIGPGQGGGWAPAEEMVPLEPTDIGNRWPDGELRDEVFDITDPMHRDLMNIPHPEEGA